MQVKIKRLNDTATIPVYSKPGDAGLDLTATTRDQDEYGNIVYGTGLAVEIPHGYVGLLFPRSSNSKKDLYLANHVGVVDSGYRGEIIFKFRPYKGLLNSSIYDIGDRIGQLMIIPYPVIELVESDNLSDTERGDDGFGSTGK
jgi:dUTP pyrophosphatase